MPAYVGFIGVASAWSVREHHFGTAVHDIDTEAACTSTASLTGRSAIVTGLPTSNAATGCSFDFRLLVGRTIIKPFMNESPSPRGFYTRTTLFASAVIGLQFAIAQLPRLIRWSLMRHVTEDVIGFRLTRRHLDTNPPRSQPCPHR